MQPPDYTRKILLCPKCQSPRLVIQEIREMYQAQRPPAMPTFSAVVTQRILCADCGAPVWPENAKAEIEEARQGIAVQNYVDSRLPETEEEPKSEKKKK